MFDALVAVKPIAISYPGRRARQPKTLEIGSQLLGRRHLAEVDPLQSREIGSSVAVRAKFESYSLASVWMGVLLVFRGVRAKRARRSAQLAGRRLSCVSHVTRRSPHQAGFREPRRQAPSPYPHGLSRPLRIFCFGAIAARAVCKQPITAPRCERRAAARNRRLSHDEAVIEVHAQARRKRTARTLARACDRAVTPRSDAALRAAKCMRTAHALRITTKTTSQQMCARIGPEAAKSA